MDEAIFSSLILEAPLQAKTELTVTLARFGEPMLRFIAERDVKIVVLHEGQKYIDASPAISALNVAVDTWPTPPAGLFVVAERTVYLRSATPMTIAHEMGHALDCALGDGCYYSTITSEVRNAFASARRFVTPYAASRIDEYFAEAVRSYLGCNDPSSPWPLVSRSRLYRLDRVMHGIIKSIFDRFA